MILLSAARPNSDAEHQFHSTYLSCYCIIALHLCNIIVRSNDLCPRYLGSEWLSSESDPDDSDGGEAAQQWDEEEIHNHEPSNMEDCQDDRDDNEDDMEGRPRAEPSA